jgi:hypothetical protein
MDTTGIETIPTSWDEERDGRFFRLTASLFPSEFCAGAGALLASYDRDEAIETAAPATARITSASHRSPARSTR